MGPSFRPFATVVLLPAALLACTPASVPVFPTPEVPPPSARVILPMGPAGAAEAVGAQLDKRGFHLVDRATAPNGDRVLTYQGIWGITPVYSPYSRAPLFIGTQALGSVFYVVLKPQGSSTAVTLYGRPMMNGGTLCGDLEVALDVECHPLVSVAGQPPNLSSSDEQATVRGVALELESTVPGAKYLRPTPTPPSPPSPPKPACHMEGTQAWRKASPSQKKALLEACGSAPPAANS